MAEKPELKMTVFSDYICPFCYIGNARLNQLRDQYDLKVNWCFIEIHPETPREGQPVSALDYTAAQWQSMMENLAGQATTEGLQILPRERIVNSHQALLLSEAARQAGREPFYRLHNALFHAWFTLGTDISQESELRRLAEDAGISVPLVAAAWQDPVHETRLRDNLQLAVKTGIHAVPTFIIGDQILGGAVTIEALQQAAVHATQTAGNPDTD